MVLVKILDFCHHSQLIALLNLSVLGFSFNVFHNKAKNTAKKSATPFQAMEIFCLSLFTLATPMLLQSSSGIKYHVRIVLSNRVENQQNFRDNSIFSIAVGIQEHPLTSCYIWDQNQEAGSCKQWVLCMKAGIDERQTWMLIHDKSRQPNFSHYVVFLL